MKLRAPALWLAGLLLAAGCASTQKMEKSKRTEETQAAADTSAPVSVTGEGGEGPGARPAPEPVTEPSALPSALSRSTVTAGSRVGVELYIMSKCPFASRVLRALADAAVDLGPGAMVLEIDYIVSDNNGQLSALHGPSEIEGNKLQLCAIRHHGAEQALPFLACQADDFRSIPASWKRCARGASLDVAAIEQCAASGEGESLLRASMNRSTARNARGSPTIYIAGSQYTGGRSKQDLMRAVCEGSGSIRPAACASLPAEMEVDVLVLSDRRCKKCSTSGMLSNLRARFFPKMQVRRVDYSTPEGKQLYRRLKLRHLPAVLFSPDVEQHPRYSSISRWMTDVSGYKKLRAPASFDPTAEICDNGVDDTGNGRVDCADPTCRQKLICRRVRKRHLDLFMMSMCPFANKALLATQDLLRGYRGKIAFSIHYIADRQSDGRFSALHGQAEVEENMRQLCARQHYGKNDRYLDYIWCRAKDYRSSDWRRCATGGISARVIQRCAGGPQGRHLLDRDLQLAKQLNISGSPTWLGNNRHKFNGITAQAVQDKLCEHNPGLDGC